MIKVFQRRESLNASSVVMLPGHHEVMMRKMWHHVLLLRRDLMHQRALRRKRKSLSVVAVVLNRVHVRQNHRRQQIIRAHLLHLALQLHPAVLEPGSDLKSKAHAHLKTCSVVQSFMYLEKAFANKVPSEEERVLPVFLTD